MSNIVKSAIVDANAVKKTVEDRAKDMFLKEFSPAVKQMLSNVINETVSAGNDQPGGYSPEEDQSKIQGGTDINKHGKGPSDLKEEDELPVDDLDDDGMEDEALAPGGDQPDVSSEKDIFANSGSDPELDVREVDEPDDISGMGQDDDELSGMGEGSFDEIPPDEDQDDVLEVIAGEEEPLGDEDPSQLGGGLGEAYEEEEEDGSFPKKEESKKLREYARALRLYKRQNKILKETVNVLRNKFHKIDLFNAKLAYAFRLMHTPGLTRNEKKQIAESFDRARSVRETKIIYSTMKRALETNARRKVAPKSGNIRSVISESTKPSNAGSNRMTELAGL